jgi:hypothetical protein
LGGRRRKSFIGKKADPIRGVCLAFSFSLEKQDVFKWINGSVIIQVVCKIK